MGNYPKSVLVNNIDRRLGLYREGLVQLNLVAIVPEIELQDILNHIGAVL